MRQSRHHRSQHPLSQAILPRCELQIPHIGSQAHSSAQYAGWEPEAAIADYWSRIRDQENVYQSVTADEGPFVKVMNVGERIEVNRIEGGPTSAWFARRKLTTGFRIPADEMLLFLDEYTYDTSHDLLCQSELYLRISL